MSDSDDLSTPANFPEDTEIEFAIHQVVRAGVKEDGFSIKVARSRVEKELDLPADFFKNDANWKARSKELIETAAQEFAEEDDNDMEEKKLEVKAKPKSKSKPTAGTKRKSDDAPKAKPKRRKKSPSVKSEESEAEISAAESAKPSPPPKPKPKSQAKSEDTSALSTPPENESEPGALKQNGKHTIPASNDDDESDLSSVIDDPPAKKKRGAKTTKSSSPSATTKSKAKPKTQKPAKPDLSPDEEEIKRLQSWLLKCGIRKLWHRELASYPTSKEKIKHLKGMLEDVGMSGRFSAEKARQIKESRELAAELEAAKSFNEQWGHEDEDDSDQDGAKERKKGKGEKIEVEVEEAPVKRRPRGLVDFGDSGEESD